MTTGVPCPPVIPQFWLNNGQLASNGSILTQSGGVNAATFQDSGLSNPLPNPIPLNSRGEVSNATGASSQLFLTPNSVYTFTLFDGPNGTGNQIWVATYVNGVALTSAAAAALISTVTNTPVLFSLQLTVAEITAGVTPTNFAYPPLDLRRYGLVGGGSIDAAAASGIAVCKVLGGGRLYVAPGSYTSAAQINLNQCSGIVIQGDSAATGGVSNGTIITYSGTGSSPWIAMTSALGCQIRNMELTNSSGSFTGAFIKCGNDGSHGDSFQCSVIDVLFNAGSTAFHLDLDKTTNFNAERCYFVGGATSVKGQTNSSSSYSTTVRFKNCVWGQTISVPINWGGQAWLIEGCTFEGVFTGTTGHYTAGAFQAISTTQCSGLTFVGNWFGDATDIGGTWISTFGPGFCFTGNFMGGDPSPGSFGITLNGVSGATITGNDFLSLSVALNLATSTSKGLVFTGNSINNNVTTPISGAGSFGDGPTSQVNPNNGLVGASGGIAPFFGAAVQGWEYTQNGNLEIWGQKTITAGTGATLTYATEVSNFPGFTTAVFNVQVSAQNPSSTINAVYCSTPSTTAVNINANGTGSVTVYWRIKGK